jgi:UDP-glucose 4-epimerase
VKALVVGGAGYLGGYVVRALLQSGWEAEVIDNIVYGKRDVLPKSIPLHVCDCGLTFAVDEVLRRSSFDLVIHCACFSDVAQSMEFPLHYYHNNFIATYYLLQSLLKSRMRRFILCSDLSVYSPDVQGVINEHTPKNPQSPLGRSLIAVDGLLRDLADRKGLTYVVLRISNLVGAAPLDGHLGHGSNQMLNEIFAAALGKIESARIRKTTTLNGHTVPMTDYVDVCDVANACALVARAAALENGTEIFLGSGRAISDDEIVNIANGVMQRITPIEYRDVSQLEMRHVCIDFSAATKLLGWTPNRDLRESIKNAWNATK